MFIDYPYNFIFKKRRCVGRFCVGFVLCDARQRPGVVPDAVHSPRRPDRRPNRTPFVEIWLAI